MDNILSKALKKTTKPVGWKGESARHGLASKGVKTGRKKYEKKGKGHRNKQIAQLTKKFKKEAWKKRGFNAKTIKKIAENLIQIRGGD